MKVSLLFAWYDLWIGAFWDKKKKCLYILPLPCIGVIIKFTDMKILIWLGNFFFRLYSRLKPEGAKNIVGIPYQRDPDNVCDAYEPFLLHRAKQYFQDCETDGHYLCKKCCHRKIEIE